MNQILMEFISTVLRKAGKSLIDQHVAGDFKYIYGSADTNYEMHTEYDKFANHSLLSLLLPELLNILNTSEILIISEEINKPYIADSKMHIWHPDDIALYPGWILVIDPICGTLPYVRGIADYIISMGIMNNLTCVASGIYQPHLNELFYAEQGQGAYLNGKNIAAMSTIDKLENSYLSIEHRVYREASPQDIQNIARKAMGIRTAGTCALEMCYVACGRLDGLIKLNQSFYDYLPGSLVILESNPDNTLVELDGSTPIFPLKSLNKKTSFLATNGIITSELASYTSSWNL